MDLQNHSLKKFLDLGAFDLLKTHDLSNRAHLLLMQNFLDESTCNQLTQELKSTLQWEQESIKIFAKIHKQPRLTAWLGKGLSASSNYTVSTKATAWFGAVEDLRKKLSKLCGVSFNSALANYYRDGNDGMGYHADDEPVLGNNPIIASISLGAPRKFTWKKKQRGSRSEGVVLQNGSLLVMSGTFQHDYKHALPKSKKILSERINLTFRYLLTS